MFTIQLLTTTPSTTIHSGLIDLLCDSVEGGASVGFLSPLSRESAEAYWQDVLHEVGSPWRVLLMITTEQGEVAGSVQLSLVQKENGRHHNSGLGRRLMDAIEREV